MAAGNWVPELVELAGGQNLFGEAGKHSPWLNWESVRERDPEIMVILPCGFDIERTRRELSSLTDRPGWKSLRAVKNGGCTSLMAINFSIVQGRVWSSHWKSSLQSFTRPFSKRVTRELAREALLRNRFRAH